MLASFPRKVILSEKIQEVIFDLTCKPNFHHCKNKNFPLIFAYKEITDDER
jgi:hypothetical protein